MNEGLNKPWNSLIIYVGHIVNFNPVCGLNDMNSILEIHDPSCLQKINRLLGQLPLGDSNDQLNRDFLGFCRSPNFI